MTKTRIFIFTIVLSFFILPAVASAFEIKSGDTIYVGPDETIEGNFYVAGQTINIDGKITGDLFCAGQSINIRGEVEGDVICIGQAIDVSGQVNGSVRTAGNTINIRGNIAHNLQMFGATLTMNPEATVGWDALIGSANADIGGKIGRSLHGGVANGMISGEINGDVNLSIDSQRPDRSGLIISDRAIINGDLTYTDRNDAVIGNPASVVGSITKNLPKEKTTKKDFMAVWAWGKLYSIFASLVIGLVLISLWRKPIIEITNRMLKKPGKTIGWGIIVMFIAPILAVILIFTLIGIPLAIILFSLWILALYLSKIIVGILIGRNILENIWKKKKDSMTWAMIIGIIISWLIFSIPLIGWIFSLIAIWWGLGGLWLYLKND